MRDHTTSDPLLAAGSGTCSLCGRVGYAEDAAWLDTHLILATLVPSCDHVPAMTAVIDTRRLGPDRWCRATAASTGKRCRQRAVRGTHHCHTHRHQGQIIDNDRSP